jgi:hypothetical protein
MMLRWCASSVLHAESRFRRVKGHAEMPKLVAALRAHERTLDQEQAIAQTVNGCRSLSTSQGPSRAWDVKASGRCLRPAHDRYSFGGSSPK